MSVFPEDAFGNMLATSIVASQTPQTKTTTKNDWNFSGQTEDFGYADGSPMLASLDGGAAARRLSVGGNASDASAEAVAVAESVQSQPTTSDDVYEVVVTGVVTDEIRAWRNVNLDVNGNYIGKTGFDYSSLGGYQTRPSFDEVNANRFDPTQIGTGFAKSLGQMANGLGKTINHGIAYMSKFDPEFAEETRGDAIFAARQADENWDRISSTVIDPSLLAYSNDSQKFAGAYLEIGSLAIGAIPLAGSKGIYEGGLVTKAFDSNMPLGFDVGVTSSGRASIGDVFDPNFIGPKKFETFYRGDELQRSEFLSSMAEKNGVGETGSYLNQLSSDVWEFKAKNHSIFNDGSPFISVTKDLNVAEWFARGESQTQAGWLTEFRVPAGNEAKAFKYNYKSEFNSPQGYNRTIGLPEQEYLAPGTINPRYIYQQWQVAPK